MHMSARTVSVSADFVLGTVIEAMPCHTPMPSMRNPTKLAVRLPGGAYGPRTSGGVTQSEVMRHVRLGCMHMRLSLD